MTDVFLMLATVLYKLLGNKQHKNPGSHLRLRAQIYGCSLAWNQDVRVAREIISN